MCLVSGYNIIIVIYYDTAHFSSGMLACVDVMLSQYSHYVIGCEIVVYGMSIN